MVWDQIVHPCRLTYLKTMKNINVFYNVNAIWKPELSINKYGKALLDVILQGLYST